MRLVTFEWLRQNVLRIKIIGQYGFALDFKLSRERSKKTEAVFLVASRRSGGKSKSPGPQMISICVLTLTRTSLTAECYSAQVHLNGMERYRQVCRMHRIICA